MAKKTPAPARSDLDPQVAVGLYRRMLLIRGFEDRVQSLFLRGEVYGTTHLYSGMEASAVGFANALREGDRIACTYRGHGHLLAMGTDPEALLAYAADQLAAYKRPRLVHRVDALPRNRLGKVMRHELSQP